MKNNNILKLTLSSFALAFILNSCSKKSDEVEVPIIKEISMTQVTIKTSAGDIQLELNGEKAPITVKNFVDIANSGYFEGTIFIKDLKKYVLVNQQVVTVPLPKSS